MQKLIFFFACLSLALTLSAQKGSDEMPLLKRTYPIDSCLYFQLPVNFLVKGTATLGNGNTGVSVQFVTTDPSFSVYQGKGRFVINPDEFPVPGWSWESGHTGEGILVVPDNALAAAGGDPDADLDFPILINGFIQKVESTGVDPPFAIFFQLMNMTEN